MLSTEKAFDILPFVSDIYYKIDIKTFLKNYDKKNKTNKKEDTETKQLSLGLDLFSYVFKQSGKVKEEFFNIVAIVEDKEIEEVKNQSLAKTIMTIKDLFSDKDLVDFFKEAM